MNEPFAAGPAMADDDRMNKHVLSHVDVPLEASVPSRPKADGVLGANEPGWQVHSP